MTFEIPKDMKFEEISPRKGKGAASTYRETVRCGLYIWNKTNIRLNTVIGNKVASRVGITLGSQVQVKVGISDNIVLATYSKGMGPNGAYYKAKANGKRPEAPDIRIMTTLDVHLHEYFREIPIKLIKCEYMTRDARLIVRLHDNLLCLPDDPQRILGF